MSSDLENLSISEFKKIKKDNKQKLKKEYHNIIKKTKVNRRYIKKYKKQENRLIIPNPIPNPNQNLKHLTIILRSVFEIKQFQLILQLIFVKHLKEQSENILKE